MLVSNSFIELKIQELCMLQEHYNQLYLIAKKNDSVNCKEVEELIKVEKKIDTLSKGLANFEVLEKKENILSKNIAIANPKTENVNIQAVSEMTELTSDNVTDKLNCLRLMRQSIIDFKYNAETLDKIDLKIIELIEQL